MKSSLNILFFLSVFWLLFSCSEDKGKMLRQLEMLEAANRADSVMDNDSLAEDLVVYFDDCGTPNEQMRARYMLGRTYYDLGELPRALETYLKAAACADTASSDCDYKVLSRIHAQSADIYNDQIQPQSQLTELRKAEYYARLGKDTLMALECYAEQAYAYQILNNLDSVILVEETAARMFHEIHNEERYAQSLGGAITSLVEKGDLKKARDYAVIYERSSGFLDKDGNIKKGREMYYYAKGKYYLASNYVDSAEVMFRKLMKTSSLNRRIAGSKGLQQVFERKGISDSIAKYANLGYELNDSAYLTSEMQNIQKFQASYNYNYHKQRANENALKAERISRYFIAAIAFIVIAALLVFLKGQAIRRKNALRQQDYHRNLDELSRAQNELLKLHEELDSSSEILTRKNNQIMELQERIAGNLLEKEKIHDYQREFLLKNSAIVKHLTELVDANPPKKASSEDFHQLRTLINEVIPSFYSLLNANGILSEIEYEVCMLIRIGFSPSAICKLSGITDGYVANMRKRLLKKVFGIDQGQPKDFDRKVLSIV